MKSLLLYLSSLFFICTWWYCSFFGATPSRPLIHVMTETPKHFPLEEMLSSLKREELRQALEGDFELMMKLIVEWEGDAEILADMGYQVKRLAREDYKRGLMAFRSLRKQESRGFKWLPQTYVAASLLLTLVPTEEIIALPEGFREQKGLYPEEKAKRIARDFNKRDAEWIGNARPDGAFVASYSHPMFLTSLGEKKIPVHRMENVVCLDDIYREIGTLGRILHCGMEADLLEVFVKAAMTAIDNRRQLFSDQDVLYLSYYSYCSYPSQNTLVGEMVRRLGMNKTLDGSGFTWHVPLTREAYQKLGATKVILGGEGYNFFKGGEKIALVDEKVLTTPNHYVVLAYYDLYEAYLKVVQ